MSQKPSKPTPGRTVYVGDSLYYKHPKRGATSGRVLAAGQHGVTLESEDEPDGQVRVLWDDVLGHKERRSRNLKVIERGEDGGIAEDEDGRRVFVAGEIPDPDAMTDDELLDRDEKEKLAKSLTPGGVSLLEQAQIDATLMRAGLVPSLEYVQATYGAHWSLPMAVEPLVQQDTGPDDLVKAIAEVKAHADAAVLGLRSEVALALAGGKVADAS